MGLIAQTRVEGQSDGALPGREVRAQAGAAQRPDDVFNEIFAKLGSHRDRALVAFYVSTGARASELLSVIPGSERSRSDVNPKALRQHPD